MQLLQQWNIGITYFPIDFRCYQNDEVITQALTFVATCNAIKYAEKSVFIDVDLDTLGLSPKALENWLTNVELRDGKSFNLKTGSRVAACVPSTLLACLYELLKLWKFVRHLGSL